MVETLTRAGLHRLTSETTGHPQVVTEAVATRLFELIGESLSSGENVKLTGFGTLEVRSRGARVGRNPRTGEVHPVSARRVVVFTPSAQLRQRLDALRDETSPGESADEIRQSP